MIDKMTNLIPERQWLLDEFSRLDERDEIIHKPRFSRHQETGEVTLIGIIARKIPRWFYPPEIAERHRLLIIKLVKEAQINGKLTVISMEFPYSIPDLEAMWECMFDVWVKPAKKYRYAKQFKRLIERKLLQAGLKW